MPEETIPVAMGAKLRHMPNAFPDFPYRLYSAEGKLISVHATKPDVRPVDDHPDDEAEDGAP